MIWCRLHTQQPIHIPLPPLPSVPLSVECLVARATTHELKVMNIVDRQIASVVIICTISALHKRQSDTVTDASGRACAVSSVCVVLAPEFECNDLRICD